MEFKNTHFMNEAVTDCTAAKFIEEVFPMRSLSHPLSHTEVSLN